jgi:uncharacterized protein YktA (UPF0223 family)
MRLVFMVEEPSMKELLEILLPKILPEGMEKPLIIKHNGKSDLAASIPRKLKGWQNPEDKFIIIHDQDSYDDCKLLKEELFKLSKNSRNDVLIRIACRELEAWYFGDLEAVSRAYNEDLTKLSLKRKYRNPDKIGNAKDEIRKLIPKHQQISGARLIAKHMNVEQNTSPSFNAFVNGVRKMAAC